MPTAHCRSRAHTVCLFLAPLWLGITRPALSQENLVPNPGFEAPATKSGAISRWSSSNASPYGPNIPPGKTYAPSQATLELDFDTRHSGRASARLTGSSKLDRATLRARVRCVLPGAKYYVSAWVKSADVAPYTELGMSAADLIWDAFATPAPNTDWTRYWAVIQTPKNTSRLVLTLWANRLCGTVWFDDVVLRPATPEDERLYRARFWITELKDLCIETTLVERGAPRAVIVCPGEPGYAQLAERIASNVAEATGARLSIKHPTDVTSADKRTRHLICLGDMSNNDVLAALYCQQRILTDKGYPGAGGFELRTIHNPWGHGRNVILVGGSDCPGVAQAVGALLEKARPGSTLKLPRLMVVRLPNAKPAKPAEPAAARQYADKHYTSKLKARLDIAMQMGSEYSTKLLPYRHGDRYFRTGDEQQLLIFRELMLKVLDRFDEAAKPCCLEDLWTPLITWDRVEEHPAFSHDERLAITNFFLAAARRAFKRSGPGWRARKDMLWGHPLDHALSVLFVAEYLWRDYRFPEAKEWIDTIAPILSRNAKTVLMPIDEFKYQTYSMRFALHSSLTRGDFEYFLNDNARRFANRTVTYLDNVRGVWGNSAWLFNACAWYYGDARLAWLARNLGEHSWGKPEPQQGPFATGMRPVEPVDMLGLTVADVDRSFYTHAPQVYGDSRPNLNVPRGRAFHAVSFRSGFSPDSLFVRMDGCSRGLHRRHDGSALTWLGQHGQTFIGPGGPYEHIAPRFQNAVSIVRNGQSERIPAYASLETCVDLGAVAFVRSAVDDYSGADWSRSLVCVRDKYVVLFDDVTCRKPGDFALRCHFIVEGETELSGRLARTTQHGRTFFIENADASDLRLDKTSDYVHKKVSVQSRFLRESTVATLASADTRTFVNLLSSVPSGKEPRFRVDKRLASRVALVGNACVGAPGGGFQTDGLSVDADQFYFDDELLAIARGTSFRSGRALFSSDVPVSIVIHLRKGTGIVFTRAEANISLWGDAESALVDGTAAPLKRERGELSFNMRPGRHVFELKGWNRAKLSRALAASLDRVQSAPAYEAPRATAAAAPPRQLRLLWRWEPVENVLAVRNIGTEAQAASPNDVFVRRGPSRAIDGVAGDDFSHHGWTACNCCDGKTPAVLDLTWKSPIRIEGVVFHWSNAEPNLFSRGYVLSYWSGREWAELVKVEKNSKTKREHEFPNPVVTTRFRFLCPVGSGSWSGRNYLQEIEVLGGCPIDVSSRSQSGWAKAWPKGEEVVVSVDLRKPRRIAGLDIDGLDAAEVRLSEDDRSLCQRQTAGQKHVSIRIRPPRSVRSVKLALSPRPGHGVEIGDVKIMATLPPHRQPINELACLATGDLEGDGKPDIVVGSKNHAVYALNPSGTLKWEFAAGGPVNAVCAADLDRDGKLEVAVGSDLGDLHVLEHTGRKRWSFRGPIVNGVAPRVMTLCAADLNNDAALDLVAGAKNYHYYAFDAKGKMLWKYFRAGSEATKICADDLDRDGDVEILAGSYYFWSQALDRKGKALWGISSELPAVTAVCMADVEGDGPREALYAVGHDLRVCGAKGTVKWQRNVGDYAHAIAVADLDRDGKPEVVVASSSFHVYVFDGAGRERWRRNVGAEVRAICIADLDGDGRCEVVAGAEDCRVHVFRHDGVALASYETGGCVSALAAVGTGHGGKDEVVAASRDGAVYRLRFD